MYVRCTTLMAPLHITPCYPTISGRISCRPGFRVKGIGRQLVKRIIPAYTLLRPTNALHIIKSLLELLLETGIHPCKTVSLYWVSLPMRVEGTVSMKMWRNLREVALLNHPPVLQNTRSSSSIFNARLEESMVKG